MKSTPTLLAALAALLLAGCDRNRITAENAARLTPGMPESEIPAVLGDTNFGKSWGNKTATYTYQGDKLWVKVDCVEGKITRVITRDPARKVPLPARNEMPLLDLTLKAGIVSPAMEAALKEGGVPGLAEWMKRELVPGRPVRVSDGRETVLVDRAIFELNAVSTPDYGKPLLAPLTDENEWFTVSTTALSELRSDSKPPFAAHILVAQPEKKK